MKKSKGYHPSPRTSKLNTQKYSLSQRLMQAKHKFSTAQIVSVIFFIICIELVAAAGWFRYKQNKEAFLSGKNIIYRIDDVLGVSTDLATVSVDFAKKIAVGSPLIFGIGNPTIKNPDVWDKVADVGVNFLRVPIFLEWSIPQKITVTDYQSNKNNVQEITTWNTKFISSQTDILKTAKLKGMKTLGILAFAPSWLSFNGDMHGVPKNWEVYKDLVKKMYRINRPYLDYVEIWNEPDWQSYLNTDNSGLNKTEAYFNIFSNAAIGIREVDTEINDGKYVKIGGPVLSNTSDLLILQYLLKNQLTKSLLSFISVHNYDDHRSYDMNQVRSMMSAYSVSHLPLFITEWNATSNSKNPNIYLTTDKAISYTGSRFITFLNDGLNGANYFALNPVEPNSKILGHGYHAFYQINKANTELLPQAKTWKLLAKTSGLGKGNSDIFTTVNIGTINTSSFINSDGIPGLLLANESSVDVGTTITVNNLPISNAVNTFAYIASDTYDGATLINKSRISVVNKKLTFKVITPKYSVVSILMKKDQTFFDLFQLK